MTRRDPMFHHRLPPEVAAWVEREASKNERSKNAQVVFSLRQQMKKETAEGQFDGQTSTVPAQ